MMETIKALCVKYREILVYLVVGVLTTIFSWLACYVAKFFLDPTDTMQNNIINTIGWVAGVCFAYPLTRRGVFRSTNPQILKEFFGCAASRLSSGALELIIMISLGIIGYYIARIYDEIKGRPRYIISRTCGERENKA